MIMLPQPSSSSTSTRIGTTNTLTNSIHLAIIASASGFIVGWITRHYFADSSSAASLFSFLRNSNDEDKEDKGEIEHDENNSDSQQKEQQNQELSTSSSRGLDSAEATNNATTATAANNNPRINNGIVANLCECGFDLTGKSPEHAARHRRGRNHQSNLHRTGTGSILVTAKVNEYRAAIESLVTSDDVVLEIGCAEGLTTQKLARTAKIAIGVDQRSILIDKGRRRIGHLTEAEDDEKLSQIEIMNRQQQEKHQQNGEMHETQNGTTQKRQNGKTYVENETTNTTKKYYSNLYLYTADGFDKYALIDIVDKALLLAKPQQKINDDDEGPKRIQKNGLKILPKNPSQERKESNQTATNSHDGDDQQQNTKILTRKQKRDLANDTNTIDPELQPTTPAISKIIDRNNLINNSRIHAGKIDKIWVDISGSRELHTVTRMISIVESLFRPKLIVVKSDRLKDLVRRTYLPSSIIPGLTVMNGNKNNSNGSGNNNGKIKTRTRINGVENGGEDENGDSALSNTGSDRSNRENDAINGIGNSRHDEGNNTDMARSTSSISEAATSVTNDVGGSTFCKVIA